MTDPFVVTLASSMQMYNLKPSSLTYAMTVMDKICGWEDEDKWVGSEFAACMWIYTKEVLTGWQKPTPEVAEYLKRRLLSMMLCMNWVCAGTVDDHDWVSESTIPCKKKKK